jgi:HEAT repeat protein
MTSRRPLRPLCISAVSAAMTILAYLVCAQSVGASLVEPSAYGLPNRLGRLSDMTPLYERADLTPEQRTDVLLYWLNEERREPSPPTQGAGGSIDSGYIQAQVVKALGELGDPLLLSRYASDTSTLDAMIRDAVQLALAWMYDARQVPNLIRILESSSEPDYRALAATALGSMRATEAVPVLEAALDDVFSRTAEGCLEGPRLLYPVREAARGALDALADPSLAEYARARCEAFARRLKDAQDASRE